jgi:hypothetical protein
MRSQRAYPCSDEGQGHPIFCRPAALAAGRAAYPRSDSRDAGIPRRRGAQRDHLVARRWEALDRTRHDGEALPTARAI